MKIVNKIINNIINIRKIIQNNILLIVVSKGQSIDSIKTAYITGQKHFGENYVQELKNKYLKLPKDICWHMIGNLQSNKIKYIIPFIYMIHSIDSLNKLIIINKEASKYRKIIKCLIQIKISNDINKYGMSINEFNDILNFNFKNFQFIKILGIMGISSFTNDNKKIIHEYKKLYFLFKKFQNINNDIVYLSMGMSYDYKIAIKYGSNMLRLGKIIFNNNY